jgi:hypothetical protein
VPLKIDDLIRTLKDRMASISFEGQSRKMKYILLTLLLLTACGEDFVDPVPVLMSHLNPVNDFELIRTDLLNNHLEGAESEEEIAIRLRGLIHNSVTVAKTDEVFDYTRFYERYINSIYGDEPHLCSGQAYLYMLTLKAMRIPSRYVGLFNATGADYWSHATTEVFLNDKWQISDATFNTVVITNTGDYLTWRDLHEGKEYALTNDSLLWVWEIWEKAGITNHLVIYPSFMNNLFQLVPDDWDGIVNGEPVIPEHADMYLLLR